MVLLSCVYALSPSKEANSKYRQTSHSLSNTFRRRAMVFLAKLLSSSDVMRGLEGRRSVFFSRASSYLARSRKLWDHELPSTILYIFQNIYYLLISFEEDLLVNICDTIELYHKQPNRALLADFSLLFYTVRNMKSTLAKFRYRDLVTT